MGEIKSIGSEKKVPAGVLGILFGAFGVHKFILGYPVQGVIMLLGTIVFAPTHVVPLAVSIVGIVEGIIYLTMSEDRFISTYVEGRKGWF
ncbi:TM2 domain-containing protein [Candidatus Magnetoovum chiemensis]|nr:TM2 domain-containing protein [Candidatus Magnetoovum chiemensis]